MESLPAVKKTKAELLVEYQKKRDEVFILIMLNLNALANNPVHIVSKVDYDRFWDAAKGIEKYREIADQAVLALSQE